ncbi:hypothetical protein CCHR01_09765 [Colletotrichum chrysophilum]|uniref:Uncharacterized protein n=1 Tax=Colletotrichum chrysophilum TaxID=1836956 RepID=A0AAD9AG61_9PEZI|nr:hypothetical protein CCHR01_09765 [Colletotrichum chrysophilum]
MRRPKDVQFAHFSRRQGLLRLRWLLEGLTLRSSPKTVKAATDYQEHCHVDKPDGQEASRAATPSFRPLQDRRTSIGLATNRASSLAPVVPGRNHGKTTSWHSVAEAVARSLKRFPPVRESKPSIRIRKKRPHLAVTRRSHSQTLTSHRSLQPARGNNGAATTATRPARVLRVSMQRYGYARLSWASWRSLPPYEEQRWMARLPWIVG